MNFPEKLQRMWEGRNPRLNPDPRHHSPIDYARYMRPRHKKRKGVH